MSFLDIILGALLAYSLFKGLQNGLFTELASFVSLILGIFLSMKFSYFAKEILEKSVQWDPKTIQIVAFAITFLLVVVGISLSAKFLTKIVSFAHLGWINKLSGGFFRVLKTVLILSIFFNLFEKVNCDNFFVKKEILDESLFYRPIQNTSTYLYPSIEKWYDELKNKP